MTGARRFAAYILTLTVLLSSWFSVPVHASASPLFGDVDESGDLSSSDVRYVLLYTIGRHPLRPAERAAADYNEDFAADTSDARAILLAVLTNAALKPLPTLTQDDRAKLDAAAYQSEPYAIVNGHQPLFTETQKRRASSYEEYALTDAVGRCGAAYANLCPELMPTEDRDSLSSVTPTGWHNRQYDAVPGGWVYNRSHIIGFQLAGEQANRQNLITGTQYLNVRGMLPFENAIAAYIQETGHHVLYRVTPHFSGDNLLCDGVEIEAWSVEDSGEGICLHVFCYNVQPGVVFDYTTGENTPENDVTSPSAAYILNTASKKFHLPSCGSASSILEQNRAVFEGERDELIAQGYTPCGHCKP